MECQFVPGWKGLMDLMNRSGQGSAWTGAVFEGDDFEYQLGDSPFVRTCPPAAEDNPSKITHFYAIGRAKGASGR
jgi:recombination protein RecT